MSATMRSGLNVSSASRIHVSACSSSSSMSSFAMVPPLFRAPSIRSGRGSEPKPEARPVVLAFLVADGPAPVLHGHAAEEQTEARAAHAIASPRELLEEAGQQVRRNAGAFIVDVDRHRGLLVPHRDADDPAHRA